MKTTRREVLKQGMWAFAALAGCGGMMVDAGDDGGATGVPDGGDATSLDGATASDGAVVSDAWSLSPPPTFVAGSAGTYDLAMTLPAGVAQGGTFSVDPSGSALPSGMSLSPAGMLSLGSAAVGAYAGVIFAYAEP